MSLSISVTLPIRAPVFINQSSFVRLGGNFVGSGQSIVHANARIVGAARKHCGQIEWLQGRDREGSAFRSHLQFCLCREACYYCKLHQILGPFMG